MSKAWKDFERRCCKALGGDRILGNRGSGVPDSDENVPFALEAKHGYERYQLREAWIDQARRNARASAKPWLLVQAPKHSRRPVATLDFWAFCEICQKAGLIPTPFLVPEEETP
jgi:hypothetical protein